MVLLWYYYGIIMVLSLEEERRKSVFTYKGKEFFAKAQQVKQVLRMAHQAETSHQTN